MDKATEMFNRLGLPITTVINSICKFLPLQAFGGVGFNVTEFQTRGKSGHLQNIPVERCNIVSIKKAEQGKFDDDSLTYETEALELNASENSSILNISSFGIYYVVKQVPTQEKLKVDWFGVNKRSENLKELWRLELANLFMFLKKKDSVGVFECINRLDRLEWNETSSNYQKPEAKLVNDSITEVML